MRRVSTEALLALAIVSPVLVWSTWIAQGNVFPSLATSDTVWLLVLAEDLFDRAGRLAGWDLSAHTNFFPELLVVDAARRLSSNPQDFFLAYSLLSVAAIFAASCFCLWLYLRAAGVGSSGAEHATGRRLALAVFGAFLVNGGSLLLFNWGIFLRPLRYAFMPAFHFYAFVASLLIAFLAIDRFDRNLSRRTLSSLAIAALLLLVTGLSDKIAVLDTLPGLLVAAVHHARRTRRIAPGMAAGTLALLTVGALVLFGADPFWSSVARVKPYPIGIDAAGLSAGAAAFWQALLEDSAREGKMGLLQAILAVAGMASVVILFGRALWRWRSGASADSAMPATSAKAESMQVFLLASALLVPLAVLVLGRFRNESSLRFVIPAFYCSALAIAAFLLERVGQRATRARFALALAGAAALLGLAPIRTELAPFRRYSATPLMACLQRWSDRYVLRRGLGFHWESHLTTVASRGRVIVRSIAGDGRMLYWVNTLDFYSPEATAEPFTFVVLSEHLDRNGLERRFGPPAHVLRCPGVARGDAGRRHMGRWQSHARVAMEVWVYDDAGARRITEEMRRQYLKARAAPNRSYRPRPQRLAPSRSRPVGRPG